MLAFKIDFSKTQGKMFDVKIIFPIQKSSLKVGGLDKESDNFLNYREKIKEISDEKDLEIKKLKDELAIINQSSNEKSKAIESLQKEVKIIKEKRKNEKKLVLDAHKLKNQVKDTELLVEECRDLKKKLIEKETTIEKHQEIINELKMKHKEDLILKTAEIEKRIIDTQKLLNNKTNQATKLSSLLKEREKKRTTAEVMLEEQQKMNNELIEKNVKNEKIISDHEKKINELNRRITSLLAEIKSNDEVLGQRDEQVKKLIKKVKNQEEEIQNLNEELRSRSRIISDLQKKMKENKESFSKPKSMNNADELKKALEAISVKEEEIKLMKDMIRSQKVSKNRPSSVHKSASSTKLPPIAGSISERNLKAIEKKHLVKDSNEKISYRLRDLEAKTNRITALSIPNSNKIIKNHQNTNIFSEDFLSRNSQSLKKKKDQTKESDVIELEKIENYESSVQDKQPPETNQLEKALITNHDPVEVAHKKENKDHKNVKDFMKNLIIKSNDGSINEANQDYNEFIDEISGNFEG